MMTFFRIKSLFESHSKNLSETYLLNFSQMSHLIIMAGILPLYIGIDAYGLFAALMAGPGFIQSSFEAYSISVLSRNGRKEVLNKIALLVLLPCGLGLFLIYMYALGFAIALASFLLAMLLFFRSYAFAVSISSGYLTRQLVLSDILILCVYLIVFTSFVFFGVRSYFVPIAMVCCASLFSGWYLLRASGNLMQRLEKSDSLDNANLSSWLGVRAASSRLFEDGLLSLSPLVLAALISPAAAGQFRLLVSGLKAAYKAFPVRYEVALREMIRGNLPYGPLVKASTLFCLSSVSLAVIGSFALGAHSYDWILILVASSGAAVSDLALYPAASTVDLWVLLLCVGFIALSFGLACVYGLLGFSFGFAVTSYAVMFRSLFVIKKIGRVALT